MNFPDGFLSSLSGLVGFNELAFIKAHDPESNIVSIRLNPSKLLNTFENIELVPWWSWGRYLKKRPQFTLDPYFHAGCYYVQDASSMFLGHVLKQVTDSEAPLKVLDLCAAPGGKTTLIHSILNSESFIVANEIVKKRLMSLTDNVTKWGAQNIMVTHNSPSELGLLHNFFDIINIDAPCSGSGMFRKDPDSKTEWSLENVEMCSSRQKQIIADIIGALKPGGYLLYSTCSYSKAENEDIADWICENYSLMSINIEIDEEWGISETESDHFRMKGYRFYPDKVKGEGFYLTVFRKEEAIESNLIKDRLGKAFRPTESFIHKFIDLPDNLLVWGQNETYIIPSHIFGHLEYFKKSGIRIVQTGIKAGMMKGRDFVPDHALALSSINIKFAQKVSLNLNQSIDFLTGRNIPLPNEMELGWKLICYNEFALGWYKKIDSRGNNYYPKFLRIKHH